MVKTVCLFCCLGCELGVETDGNEAKRIVYIKEARLNGGSLCPKGNSLLELLNHPARLIAAAERKEGELTWMRTEEAIRRINERLEDLSDSTAVIISANSTDEEVKLAAKLGGDNFALGAEPGDIDLALGAGEVESGTPEELSETKSEAPEEAVAEVPRKVVEPSTEEEPTSEDKTPEASVEIPEELFKPESTEEPTIDIKEQISEPQTPIDSQQADVDLEGIEIPGEIFKAEDKGEMPIIDLKTQKPIVEDESKPDQTITQISGEGTADGAPESGEDVELIEGIVPTAQEFKPGGEGVDVEQIEGLQTRDDTLFSAPDEVEQLPGLQVRQDFTPPDETLEIEGIETSLGEASSEISSDVLENLLEEEAEGKSEREQTSSEEPTPPTSPPKDIATATTAEIFAAQGMIDKAIEIYQDLISRPDIPEEDKNRFLSRVEILKKRLGQS